MPRSGGEAAVSLRPPEKLQRREAREKGPILGKATAIGGVGEGSRDNQEKRQPGWCDWLWCQVLGGDLGSRVHGIEG